MFQAKPFVIMIIGLFLFLIDRYFKWQALHDWAAPRLVGWFGWQPFFNPGVAFGIPVPSIIIISISILIILVIIWVLFISNRLSVISDHRSPITDPRPSTIKDFALILILAGATSNLVDRIAYGYTVDYFRIYTSMINVADVMIVAGFALYLLSRKQQSRRVDKLA